MVFLHHLPRLPIPTRMFRWWSVEESSGTGLWTFCAGDYCVYRGCIAQSFRRLEKHCACSLSPQHQQGHHGRNVDRPSAGDETRTYTRHSRGLRHSHHTGFMLHRATHLDSPFCHLVVDVLEQEQGGLPSIRLVWAEDQVFRAPF